MQALEYQLTGRTTLPQDDLSTQRGYNLTPNTPIVSQKPQIALPFDQTTASQRNLQAVVNSLNPTLYKNNQNVLAQINQSIPMMRDALVVKTSVYDGVDSNFFKNRLMIAKQRNREDSLYAFT